VNLAPENVSFMSNLGVALLYAGSLDESRKVLQESIRLAPTYPGYTNLGNLDLKQGRCADAAVDYEKALEINKSDYRVWSDLAVAYSRTPGQKERAKDCFAQAAKLCRVALKANPNDPVMLSDLSELRQFYAPARCDCDDQCPKRFPYRFLVTPINRRSEFSFASEVQFLRADRRQPWPAFYWSRARSGCILRFKYLPLFRHYRGLQIPRLRYSPGLAPTTRLNALLNAASDS
jgi:tetratricopeptide (TPR) repeat protein